MNLSNNQISDLTGLEHLLNLKVLNLAYNNIRRINELEKVNSLEYLNISNNAITNLTGISKLTKLRTLNLSNNQLSNVEELNSLENLKKIYLQGNNIEQSSQTRLQESLGIEVEQPIVKIRQHAPSGSSINVISLMPDLVAVLGAHAPFWSYRDAGFGNYGLGIAIFLVIVGSFISLVKSRKSFFYIEISIIAFWIFSNLTFLMFLF